MRIYLKKLTITNFKGIPHFEVAFNHITNIFGENGTGKTTIFDAFLWLFFSKNTEGKSDFEAKRLDEKNKFIKDLEAEVSAILHIDGQEICVKKVLRQKWVKRRGELNSNYNGDENIYYWNDVPLKESEFKTKIKAIIDENLFRLITNPFYFNSLNWKERRNILIDIAGNISNSEVFDKLLTHIQQTAVPGFDQRTQSK
jgi:exonuclease SbcC